MIERYTLKERLCHWLTGLSYLYCLTSGLALYTPYLFWMVYPLGGGPTARFWHPFIGMLFFVAAMWMHSIWRSDIQVTKTDREWLDKVEDYATNRDELLPPQGRFNAGQKLFYWAMFYGAFLLIVSGLFMWFPEYVPFNLRWIRPIAVILHEGAALITIGAFIIHIYMGIFMVPGSMTAMIRGWVTTDWARTHHRLWYRRITGQGPNA
ncbi:MAG TPA: formate dehydrogenase subunit gamma [Acidisarcina sp.]|nr:formate dehydrogenase subunit gamma [Acidisarcina sp.]